MSATQQPAVHPTPTAALATFGVSGVVGIAGLPKVYDDYSIGHTKQ